MRVAERLGTRQFKTARVLLQWSRNLRVAESWRRAGWPWYFCDASMEPQLEGCGKCTCHYDGSTYIALQWSRNLRVAESLVPAAGPIAAATGLQWSRNLRVAERRQGLGPQGRTDASMEPQLEGCGKVRAGLPLEVGVQASMEPQLEGCGKMDVRRMLLQVDAASMEPQLEGCGKSG